MNLKSETGPLTSICSAQAVTQESTRSHVVLEQIAWFKRLGLAVLLLLLTLLTRPGVARAALAASGSSDGARASSLIGDGIRAYDSGNYPTAIENLRQAQTLVPDNSSAALY